MRNDCDITNHEDAEVDGTTLFLIVSILMFLPDIGKDAADEKLPIQIIIGEITFGSENVLFLPNLTVL